MDMDKIRRFGELQEEIFQSFEGWLPLITFSSEQGISIHNPFMDESGRFIVDPVKEYGEGAIKAMGKVIGKIEEEMGISVEDMKADSLRIYLGSMYYQVEKVYPGEFREISFANYELCNESHESQVDDTIKFEVQIPERFERFIPEAARALVMPVDSLKQIEMYAKYDISSREVSLNALVGDEEYEAKLTPEMKEVLLDEMDIFIDFVEGKSLEDFSVFMQQKQIWDALEKTLKKTWPMNEQDENGCYNIEIPADYRDSNKSLLESAYKHIDNKDLRAYIEDEIYVKNFDSILYYEQELLNDAGFKPTDPYYQQIIKIMDEKIHFTPDYGHFFNDDLRMNLFLGTEEEKNSDFTDIHDNLYKQIVPWEYEKMLEDAKQCNFEIEKPDNGLMWLVEQQGYTLQDLKKTMEEYRSCLDNNGDHTGKDKPDLILSYEDKMKSFRENHSNFLASICEELDNHTHTMGCLTVLVKSSLFN